MIRFIRRKIKEEVYDYIIFDYSQTFAMAKAIKHPHKLLVTHDVIYQRYEREGSKLLWWIKKSEGKLVKDAEKIYAFSEKDCKLIKNLYEVDCDYTPVFIKKSILETKPNETADYHVFFADWSRRDNSESLEWFLKYVAFRVQDIPFKVIGGGLSFELKNLVDRYDNIDYLGFVDNPYQIIANAKSEICPLHTGAGIKVKCLEALACGTPIIGTSVAFEGIDSTFNRFLFLANSPDEYVKKINEIDYSLKEKTEIKNLFLASYSQKSIINYIIQDK
jgi:glycosyltransferase involved in cell wall biosynthesis